jgi:hypothetical protein
MSYSKSYIEYVHNNILNLHFIFQDFQREERMQTLSKSAMKEGMPLWPHNFKGYIVQQSFANKLVMITCKHG